MKRFLTALLVLATLIPAARVIPAAVTAPVALADEAAPQVEFYMVDTGANSPNLGGDCYGAGQRFGWGHEVRDTIDNDNSDCAKVRITNPSSRYDQDFRICFSLGGGWDETTRCTPWASEGGGPTGIRTSTYDWAIGYMQNWTEARPLAGGGYIENVRVGLQWYELPDHGSCGASGGLAWADQNSPESPWTWGGSRDNDPGCAQMFLQASYVSPYQADYAGTNLGSVQLQPNTTYGAGDGYRVVMRNLGHAWESTQQVGQVGNCDGYEPGPDAGTCSFTKIMTSPNIKLSRLDGEPFSFSPQPLQYQQEITVTHRSYEVTLCNYSAGRGGNLYNGGSDQPLMEMQQVNSGIFGIPVAHALPRMPEPGEPGEPSDPPCDPYTEWVEQVTESPASSVIAPQTANYDAAFTTPGAGNYTLRFQLQKTDGPSAGTDGEGRFGPVVEIPVTVGTPPQNPTMSMSCPVAELTVRQGEVASYAVTVASQGGFTGNVGVSASGLPAGASSPGANISVPANGAASGIVPVVTSASTPAGSSMLTFTATGAGVSPASCTSMLTVIGSGNQTPRLDVRPGSAAIRVGEQAQFGAYYDPDGDGPQGEQNVTGASSWSSGPLAGALGNGVFSGIAVGTAYPTASYNGMTKSASLTITNIDVPPGGDTPTLSIRPGSATAAIGQQVSFRAYYDADGPLRRNQEEEDVTDRASWGVAPGSVARNDQNGLVTALAAGSASVTANFGGVTGTASLTVSGGPTTTNTCSFSASPSTLFIPPARSTTLTWQCGAPTTCTVTNMNSNATVATGGQTGSGQATPNATTRFRLSCEGGIQQDLTVRVFDVSTRVEILPR